MSLFDGKEFVENENVYLANIAKGIELVNLLVSGGGGLTLPSSLDGILQQKILPLIARLELHNETEIYRALKKISNRITEQEKIRILQGKKIVGIGGKFSSGKSCFINSITNATLPEGQEPTTSIATYIVRADKGKNVAITKGGESVEIDKEAVEALTHAFYQKYNIGFSKLIKNLVVYTPGLIYPNIAILDTPGYSKADNNLSGDSSDLEIAREQLKSVDYLIWLVDSNKGTFTQGDLDFIHTLNIKNEMLVVFTSASMRTESDLRKIIDVAKKTLRSANIKLFDVIAYDSILKKEIVGKGILTKYLDTIDTEGKVTYAPEQELEKIREQLEGQVNDLIRDLSGWDKETSAIITKTTNIEHIGSIIMEHTRNKACLQMVIEDKKYLMSYMDALIKCCKSNER